MNEGQSEQYSNTVQEESIHLRVLYSLKTFMPLHILASVCASIRENIQNCLMLKVQKRRLFSSEKQFRLSECDSGFSSKKVSGQDKDVE